MAATRVPLLIIDSVDVRAKAGEQRFVIDAAFHINGTAPFDRAHFSCRFETASLPGGTQNDLGDYVRDFLFERFRAAETAVKPAEG